MCPTSNLTKELRPYQREDCEFLKQYPAMGCFNEQRTGKTPTSISAMIERGLKRTVIICPKSALYPWSSEWQAWAGTPATIVSGTPTRKKKLIAHWTETAGALIVSYGAVKQTKTANGLIDEIIKAKPDSIILDEAHRIKDRNSANAKAMFKLSTKIPYRLALTGTPAPNKQDEIWSILHFLYPTQFKGYWPFVEAMFEVHKEYAKGGRTYTAVGDLKPEYIPKMQSILSKCATQRKRKDVMPWLPAKEHQQILLPPTKEQEKYLQELKDYFETEHIVTQGVLDRLIRYRQICLDPGVLDLKSRSPKTDWILDFIADYPEKYILIFSKFTKYLERLSSALTDTPHGIIIGDTSIKQRAKYVEDFQKGKLHILLINIDAGKEALTLDQADTAIFTDKYPPVGDIQQAEDRFVATTKEKADKAHVIYELIIQGTYDEQLYALLEKRATAVDVINNFQAHMKGEH